MTSALAMYYIHFEFIAKPQVDCIAAIAIPKIRIARGDSVQVFQEHANAIDAPGEPMGDAKGEERPVAGGIAKDATRTVSHILRGFRVGCGISAFRY